MNKIYRNRRIVALFVSATIASAAWAVPIPYQRIVAINASPPTSTAISGWNPAATGVAWTALASVTSTAPSTQKTVGSSVGRQVIMYKKADGYTRLVDGAINSNGTFNANFDGSNEAVVFSDAAATSLFSLVPEEIEIEPSTNDVFALVSGTTPSAAKQIYRIKKDSSGTEIATAMTFHNAAGVMTPNTNRAFVNPTVNGYKSGSITFVPKTGGGQYLVFTHQSTVYSGICHWVFEVQTGANENQLWAAESSPGVSMSKCQKTATLSGFGTAVNGINTVYVGPPGGIPATNGRFLMSRNNGPIYEVKGLFDSGPWQALAMTEVPALTTNSTDLAWVRNQWQPSLPFP